MLIWLILKIAGIVLLCLLGLILLLIILLLCLPWCYRLKGKAVGKQVELEITVSWMLRAIYLRQYLKSGEEAGGTLRIFGLRLFRDKKEVQEEHKRLREERKPDPEVLRQVGASNSLFEDPVQNELKSLHTDIHTVSEEKTEAAVSAGYSAEDPEAEKKEKISLKTIREMWQSGTAPQPEELIHLLENKLEELIAKAVRYTRVKTKDFVENGKTYFRQLLENSREALDKYEQLKELILTPDNRKPLRLLLKQVRRLLRQVLPRKGNGMLVFGLGDPYYTGKLLEVLAFLYPFYGNVIRVCPIFEEEKFEAEGDVRGRIFLIVAVYAFLRIWFNKKLRHIYSECKRVLTDEKSE